MSKTVMIVDDAPFMRLMLKKILEMGGYEVVAEARDGNEAVSRYQDVNPAITLMDLVMPGKNGVQATREILSSDPSAKIVVCSLAKQKDLILEALEIGARGIIFKPYDAEDVLEVMKRVAVHKEDPGSDATGCFCT